MTLAAADSRGQGQRCGSLLGHYCHNSLNDRLDTVVVMEVVRSHQILDLF